MKSTSLGMVSPLPSPSSEHKNKFEEVKLKARKEKKVKKDKELAGKGSAMTFEPEKHYLKIQWKFGD